MGDEMKRRRLNRIFAPDGRAVVVAMDHTMVFGMRTAGLEHPSEVIRAVVSGGADALLLPYGTARHAADALGRAGLILRVDHTLPSARWSVEAALRLGADAVCAMGFPGDPESPHSTVYLNELGVLCDRWGLPLMAEMIPGGFAAREQHTPEGIAQAARIGAEAGADFIKTLYTGDPDTFRQVVENCYVPILILGGPRVEDERGLLQMIHEALEAGARGVAMGRNIWGHPSPARMTAAIAALVHGGASVEAAMRELR